MSQHIEVKGTQLCVELRPLISAMSLEQKREMLAWLAADDEVVNYVVDAICGEDEQGWAIGSPNCRQAILARVEDVQLREGFQYNWRVWDEARQKIKDIRSQEHLYWVLYHQIDPEVSRRVFDELRRLGVACNYLSTVADEEISALRKVLDDAFAGMRHEGGVE